MYTWLTDWLFSHLFSHSNPFFIVAYTTTTTTAPQIPILCLLRHRYFTTFHKCTLLYVCTYFDWPFHFILYVYSFLAILSTFSLYNAIPISTYNNILLNGTEKHQRSTCFFFFFFFCLRNNNQPIHKQCCNIYKQTCSIVNSMLYVYVDKQTSITTTTMLLLLI